MKVTGGLVKFGKSTLNTLAGKSGAAEPKGKHSEETKYWKTYYKDFYKTKYKSYYKDFYRAFFRRHFDKNKESMKMYYKTHYKNYYKDFYEQMYGGEGAGAAGKEPVEGKCGEGEEARKEGAEGGQVGKCGEGEETKKEGAEGGQVVMGKES